jgi:hypothetical protein
MSVLQWSDCFCIPDKSRPIVRSRAIARVDVSGIYRSMRGGTKKARAELWLATESSVRRKVINFVTKKARAELWLATPDRDLGSCGIALYI